MANRAAPPWAAAPAVQTAGFVQMGASKGVIMKSVNRSSKLKQADVKTTGKISSKIQERHAALAAREALDLAERERLASQAAEIAERNAQDIAYALKAQNYRIQKELQRRSDEQAEIARKKESINLRQSSYEPNPTIAVCAKLLEEGVKPLSNQPLLDKPDTVQITGRSRRPSQVAIPGASKLASQVETPTLQLKAQNLAIEIDPYIPEPLLPSHGESKLRKINHLDLSSVAQTYSSQTLAQRIEAQLSIDGQLSSFYALKETAHDFQDQAPVTQAPVTQAPVTQAPVNQAPVNQAPVNQAPVNQAPVTQAPVTQAPVTQAPVTQAPVKQQAPLTQAPVKPAYKIKPSAHTSSKRTIDKQTVTRESFEFKTSNAILGVGISYMDQFEAHISGPLSSLWKNRISLFSGTLHIFIPLLMAYAFAHWNLTTQVLFLEGTFLTRLFTICWLFVVCGFIWTLIFIAGTRVFRSLSQDLHRFEKKGRGHLDKDRS